MTASAMKKHHRKMEKDTHAERQTDRVMRVTCKNNRKDGKEIWEIMKMHQANADNPSENACTGSKIDKANKIIKVHRWFKMLTVKSIKMET